MNITKEQSHNAASPATGLACYKNICEEESTTFIDDVKLTKYISAADIGKHIFEKKYLHK